MSVIKIMVNGLPGSMAREVVKAALMDDRFEVFPASMTGPGVEKETPQVSIGGVDFKLLPTRDWEALEPYLEGDDLIITIDFTLPSAVFENAEFYCFHGLPFVMGTTGGDRESLNELMEMADIPAVIGPNMAKQIVGFQAMMEYAALNFPGLFSGYKLKIYESHQVGKADTSGTAKAMIAYFKELGVKFNSKEDLIMIRDKDEQRKLGVPDEYLNGHGWHTYEMVSPDETTVFRFTHNVNGRKVYALGTLDAAIFLKNIALDGTITGAFDMIKILKK